MKDGPRIELQVSIPPWDVIFLQWRGYSEERSSSLREDLLVTHAIYTP